MSKLQNKYSNQKDLGLSFKVLRCQVGDENAFGDLHTEFSPKTLRYLNTLVGEISADDLNQEVWLSVYQRISTLSNIDGFRTWLFQMTRNKALDYFRKNKRVVEFKEAFERGAKTNISEGNSPNIEDENHEVLREGMEQLSLRHRETLTLNFFDGMDYDEIAIITGSSLGTVKSRIHNAKLKLKIFINTKYQNNEKH